MERSAYSGFCLEILQVPYSFDTLLTCRWAILPVTSFRPGASFEDQIPPSLEKVALPIAEAGDNTTTEGGIVSASHYMEEAMVHS